MRVTLGAIRLRHAVNTAISGRRVVAAAERSLLLLVGSLSLALALMVMRWPVVAWLPLTALLAWIGLRLRVRVPRRLMG
jgi:hypothetical protein